MLKQNESLTMHRIMIVDDEENILRALRRALAASDIETEIFSHPHEALRRAQTANFDLVISDYRMPEMDGIHLLSEMKQLQPDAMRLVLSGHADLEGLIAAVNAAGIFRFISKPWHDSDLMLCVRHALEHRAVLVENRHLADQVRAQRQELSRQKTALQKLESKYPSLVRVNWGEDGSIILEKGDT